jgi:cytidine deaminase
MIAAETVAEWLQVLGIDVRALMIRLLPVAAAYARVPISGFRVGAVALGGAPHSSATGPGSLYLGSNLEFLGQALGHSVHAERAATNNAWLHGETSLRALAVTAAPCGHCRQFLHETLTELRDLEIVMNVESPPTDDAHCVRGLADLLPLPFGRATLGVAGGLMQAEQHGLIAPTPPDPLTRVALDAANRSYAPYTKQYAGVGLRLSDGSAVGGRYAESAAFNPSMPPLESALAFISMARAPEDDFAIVDAVLVEAPSMITQRGVTAALLKTVAPGVELRHCQARLP